MKDRNGDSVWPTSVRWVGRGLLVLLLVLIGLYLALQLALHVVFDAEYVERRLNESLSTATDGRYRIDLGAVDWRVWQRAVEATQVTLQPVSEASTDSARTESNPRGRQYTAEIRAVRLEGVCVWPLLWHGSLRMAELRLDRPRLRMEPGGKPERLDTTKSEDEEGSLAYVKTSLAHRSPDVDIRRLVVRDGRFISHGRDSVQARPLPADSLWGLSLEAAGVRLDSTSLQDTSRILLSDSIRLSFKGYRHLSGDSLSEMAVGGVRALTADSFFAIDSLTAGPTVSDSEFMRRRGHRTNRLSAALGRLEFRGFDYRQALDDRSLVARSVHLDSLWVDVYRDNRLPPPPTDPPPKMPHEIIRGLSQTLRIDTIRMTNSFARYSKWEEASAEPGGISFENISATIRNVTNDPRRMHPSTPAVVQATTRVAGAGRLDATIRIPLLSSHFALSYEGRLGPMDARAFNDAFVNLSGVRVEDGHVDSLWFSAEVEQGVAKGTLHGRYEGLDVEMLDKETHERGLRERIGTFVLDDVMLKSSNTEEDSPPRTGTIEHEHEEDDTFFKFLWHSVRSGLYSLVGVS